MNRAISILTAAVFFAAANAEEPTSIKDPPADHANPFKEIPNRPKGEYATVNGIKMYYEIFGKGEPLLLIHGGSASIESWFEQLPELAKHYRVIAPDSRGHGRTQDSTNDLSYKLMAADFAALLKHLKITNAIVVGWSDGGVIGLELAMSNPSLVKKLVTMGANFRADGMTEEIKAGLAASGPNDHPPMLVEGYKALSPDGPEHWPVIFGKLKNMWLNQPNYTKADLKKIQCPTLVMVGDHDIVRPEHSVKLFQSIPNAQLCVIPGASHYAPIEKPKTVNGTIAQFLKE